MLQILDEGVLRYLNGYATRSWLTDMVLTTFLPLPSVKMLPIVTCLVWIWFGGRQIDNQRSLVIQTFLGAAGALITSRLVQNFTSHRPRPIHSATIDFVLPFGVAKDTLPEWSSFPSDNAALAFALATGVWFASKPLGSLSLIWAAVAVGFPRIYSGFHYPSDVVCGALLGAFFTAVCISLARTSSSHNVIPSIERRVPELFYSCFFVLAYQITTMFEDVRRMGRAISAMLFTSLN
jgi:undecaprenyl-diphosphatase